MLTGNFVVIIREGRLAASKLHHSDSEPFFAQGSKLGQRTWDDHELGRILYNGTTISKNECGVVSRLSRGNRRSGAPRRRRPTHLHDKARRLWLRPPHAWTHVGDSYAIPPVARLGMELSREAPCSIF